jgi:hypothetical protein
MTTLLSRCPPATEVMGLLICFPALSTLKCGG